MPIGISAESRAQTDGRTGVYGMLLTTGTYITITSTGRQLTSPEADPKLLPDSNLVDLSFFSSP